MAFLSGYNLGGDNARSILKIIVHSIDCIHASKTFKVVFICLDYLVKTKCIGNAIGNLRVAQPKHLRLFHHKEEDYIRYSWYNRISMFGLKEHHQLH